MGVRGLLTKTSPFRETRSLRGGKVVIDGPALAHFLCEQSGSTLSSLVQAVFDWLKSLEVADVKILAIYFDGALPDNKTQIRIHRQWKSSAWILNALQKLPHGYLPEFDKTSKPPDRDSPKGPLFIPYIIDCLLESPEYRSRTFVVPGEADDYCASHAASGEGITVISGDADIILHNLGKNGGLVLPSDLWCGRALRYEAPYIEERLGIPKGSLPVYASLLSLKLGDSEIVDRVKTSTYDHEEFERWVLPYRQLVPLNNITRYGSFLMGPPFLDPRLSEVVVKYIDILHGKSSSEEGLCWFPQVMIDSPNETSAWSISQSVRQFAFSLLRKLPGEHSVTFIREFTRVMSIETPGNTLQLLPEKELTHDCNRLFSHMSTFKASSDVELLMSVVLWLEARHYVTYGKTPFSWRMIQSNEFMIRDGEPLKGPEFPWPYIHWRAQVQGFSYSLRMACQMLSFLELNEIAIPGFASLVRDLHSKLPSYTRLPSLAEIDQFFRSLNKNPILETICLDFDMEPPLQPTKSKGIKRASDGKLAPPSSVNRSPSSRNPFNLLGEE